MDYRDKNRSDLEIERLQAQPHAALGDRLGKITLPASVPAGELPAVNYAIRGYFLAGTRNAEVDAVLPIPGKGASDWGYSWIPVVGPIIGGVLGALAWKLFWP